MTESAIAAHLIASSPSQTPNLVPGYVPPYPTYTSRLPESTDSIIILVLGSQHEESELVASSYARVHKEPSSEPGKAQSSKPETSYVSEPALQRMIPFFDQATNTSAPKFYDLASLKETAGVYEQCIIAYWDKQTAYDDWKKASGFWDWWHSLDPLEEAHGWFLEVFFPCVESFENAFTDSKVPEGAAHMQESASGAIQQHGYWGSMRDRLAKSQFDSLKGEEVAGGTTSVVDSRTRRIRVPGKKNLAVIRSGQDWSAAPKHEQDLYLDTMQETLMAGMRFLRDQGGQVGCYSCRFMRVMDPETRGRNVQKTFGLAYFHDLGSLESWSKDHKTHKRIYGGFFRYAKELGSEMQLRFFHEVFVPERQFFEYVGCHPRSGMLTSM